MVAVGVIGVNVGLGVFVGRIVFVGSGVCAGSKVDVGEGFIEAGLDGLPLV